MSGYVTTRQAARVSALVALLMGTLSLPGRAQETAPAVASDVDADETGWLNASVGVAVGDVLHLNSKTYRPGFDPVPTLSVGWAWRLSAFDLGLCVEHVPGAHSSTFEGQPTRLGDQIGVMASFRYRFITKPWGGFYASINPGLGVFMTTETLRGAIALIEGVRPEEVAPLGLGFNVTTSTGFFTRLSETLQFVIDVSASTTLGVLELDGEQSAYERYRARFRAGLEWRL